MATHSDTQTIEVATSGETLTIGELVYLRSLVEIDAHDNTSDSFGAHIKMDLSKKLDRMTKEACKH